MIIKVNKHSIDLKICHPGTYLNAETKTCDICEANSYSMSAAMACTPCPEDMTSPEGSKSRDDCCMFIIREFVG